MPMPSSGRCGWPFQAATKNWWRLDAGVGLHTRTSSLSDRRSIGSKGYSLAFRLRSPVPLDVSGMTTLITGGTGSFGSTMVRRLLATNVREVRIFSRDETKQDDMRRRLADARAKFYL